MKRTALIVTASVVAVASALVISRFFPRPVKDVADILRPTLDARLRSDESNYAPGFPAWEVEERLGHLVDAKTAAADTTSVILFDYYLGEHNGEIQLCAVTRRGRKVLPLIEVIENVPRDY